jgi:hypothetical protein
LVTVHILGEIVAPLDPLNPLNPFFPFNPLNAPSSNPLSNLLLNP